MRRILSFIPRMERRIECSVLLASSAISSSERILAPDLVIQRCERFDAGKKTGQGIVRLIVVVL